MFFNDIIALKEYKDAPTSGTVLAYTKQKVVYEKYNSTDGLKELLRDADIIEIHLFDKEKEFRCLKSESSRFNGMVAYVESVSIDDEDNIYIENCFLEKEQDKITVINHIAFDDNGMAAVDSYRLVSGGC